MHTNCTKLLELVCHSTPTCTGLSFAVQWLITLQQRYFLTAELWIDIISCCNKAAKLAGLADFFDSSNLSHSVSGFFNQFGAGKDLWAFLPKCKPETCSSSNMVDAVLDMVHSIQHVLRHRNICVWISLLAEVIAPQRASIPRARAKMGFAGGWPVVDGCGPSLWKEGVEQIQRWMGKYFLHQIRNVIHFCLFVFDIKTYWHAIYMLHCFQSNRNHSVR